MSLAPSAMREMSKAIRLEMEKHSSTLKGLPDDVLKEYEQIVTAYALDLRQEMQRRGLA